MYCNISFKLRYANKDRYARGDEIVVLFKESEVSIAKNFIGEISLQNRFTCKVEDIEKGDLLAQLRLSFFNHYIDSIISMKSVKNRFASR